MTWVIGAILPLNKMTDERPHFNLFIWAAGRTLTAPMLITMLKSISHFSESGRWSIHAARSSAQSPWTWATVAPGPGRGGWGVWLCVGWGYGEGVVLGVCGYGQFPSHDPHPHVLVL